MPPGWMKTSGNVANEEAHISPRDTYARLVALALKGRKLVGEISKLGGGCVAFVGDDCGRLRWKRLW